MVIQASHDDDWPFVDGDERRVCDASASDSPLFTRTLKLKDRPTHYSITLSLSVAALVALSALVLALYLGISVRQVPSSP